MKYNLEKIKKILPSKKFALIIGAGAVLLIVFFATANLIGGTKGYIKGGGRPPVSATGTLGDVINRDSNGNGIADWEESLWGLDPKIDGEKNKQIIEQKRKQAGIIPTTGGTISETPTEQFSRDLVATIFALHQSGSPTPEAVTNLSLAIGGDIDTKRSTEPTYRTSSISSVSAPSREKYKKNLEQALTYYIDQDIGSELDSIAESLDVNDEEALSKLSYFSDLYKNLAEDVVDLKTPKDAVTYALALANASAKISKSLSKIKEYNTDALSALVGVDEYLSGLDDFDAATSKFAAYFSS